MESVTVLHTFSPRPMRAARSLIQATDGNFYGTAETGGPSGAGVMFRLGSRLIRRQG